MVLRRKILGVAIPSGRAGRKFGPPHAGELKEMFLRAVQMLGDRQTDQALAAFDRLAAFTENATAHEELDSHERSPDHAGGRQRKGSGTTLPERSKRTAIIRSRKRTGCWRASSLRRASNLPSPKSEFPHRSQSSIRTQTSRRSACCVLPCTIGRSANSRMPARSSIPFSRRKIPESENWIEDYKPLAADYYGDCNLLAPIEKALPEAINAASAQTLVEKVRTRARISPNPRTGARAAGGDRTAAHRQGREARKAFESPSRDVSHPSSCGTVCHDG